MIDHGAKHVHDIYMIRNILCVLFFFNFELSTCPGDAGIHGTGHTRLLIMYSVLIAACVKKRLYGRIWSSLRTSCRPWRALDRVKRLSLNTNKHSTTSLNKELLLKDKGPIYRTYQITMKDVSDIHSATEIILYIDIVFKLSHVTI